MKKNIIVLLITILFCLSSCNFKTKYKSEKDYIEIASNMILDALNNKDKDSLIDLFAESIRENINLNEKIDKIFELYKCDEFIEANIPDTASGSKAWDNGVEEWNIIFTVFNIHTISNDELSDDYGNDRFYNLRIGYYIVNKTNPKLEGITSFRLEVLNRDFVEIYESIGNEI